MVIKKILTKFKKISQNKIVRYITYVLAFIVLLCGLYFSLFYAKIYPNIYIQGKKVGGLGTTEAEQIISQLTPPTTLTLKGNSQEYFLNPVDFGTSVNYADTVKRAFSIGRSGNLLLDFGTRIKQLFVGKNLGLNIDLNYDLLYGSLLIITSDFNTPAINPQANLVNGEVVVNPGQTGLSPNLEKLTADIGYALANQSDSPIIITTKETGYSLTEPEIKTLKERGQKMIGKSLIINLEGQKFELDDFQIVEILDARQTYNQEKISQFIQTVREKVEKDPQNAVFSFVGGRVQQFKPSENGVSVKTEEFKNSLIFSLSNLEKNQETNFSFELPVTITEPKIKTEDVNNLGIEELIGTGSSKFAHSIANRIHNIELASSKFEGVLIAPKETFSFNEVLGDVSAFTGYKQAYVIKEGKTVLGDGGGVCQVSTTLFRAAMNAGLPITERKPHSYRVGYYEQDSPPGFDATVFAPTADLKFENNTQGHILIQTVFDAKNASLVFNLYGTKDEREITIGKPVTSGVTAPGEDIYIDDPTLPLGTVKQIEYRAWGSTVVFDYKVVLNQEVLTETKFVSRYKPWQAVYLKGTATN